MQHNDDRKLGKREVMKMFRDHIKEDEAHGGRKWTAEEKKIHMQIAAQSYTENEGSDY